MLKFVFAVVRDVLMLAGRAGKTGKQAGAAV